MGAPAGQPGTGNDSIQLPQTQNNMDSSGGSKGTGQPVSTGYGGGATTTPMGTPIVYGKSYLNPSSFVSNSQDKKTSTPVTPVDTGNYGYDADGYANGSTNIQPQYFEDGTTGVDDPWAWASQQKPVAPLAATIQPSQEQPSGGAPQDPLVQMAEAGAVNAMAKGMEAGFKGYQLGNAAQAAQAAMAPLSANAAIGAAAPAMSVAPAMATPAAAALTQAGVTGLAAPAMSTAAGAALGAGGTAAAAPAAAGALGAAGAAGGQAALAAMGPVGWAIGAGLLAKKMGIF